MIIQYKNHKGFMRDLRKNPKSLVGKVIFLSDQSDEFLLIGDDETFQKLSVNSFKTFLDKLLEKKECKPGLDDAGTLRSIKYSVTRFAAFVQVARGINELEKAIDRASADALEMIKNFMPKKFMEDMEDKKNND